jgi:hypothetical protein
MTASIHNLDFKGNGAGLGSTTEGVTGGNGQAGGGGGLANPLYLRVLHSLLLDSRRGLFAKWVLSFDDCVVL